MASISIQTSHHTCHICLRKTAYKMKRLICLLFTLIVIRTIQAQSETDSGLLSHTEFSQTKDLGGFILDMGTMLNIESLIVRPPMSLNLPLEGDWATSTNFSFRPFYQFKPSIRYMGPSSTYYSTLYPSIGNGPLNWQSTSFTLNNGIRINTYGEYDSDGYKRYNPSALPWEKNNFNAAFEIKSPNGKFGFKVEVHHGRNYPY